MKTAQDEYLGKKEVECFDNDWDSLLSLQQDDDLCNWSRKKPRTICEAVQWSLLPRGTGKYTQFTDSVYKLPLYLAQFSLVSFDKRQVFENVILLDTMRYMSDHHCATYLITFQATFSTDYDHEWSDDESTDDNQMIDNEKTDNQRTDNVQTFQTKIFVSLHPTTRIQTDFVRIKSFEFNYYWEYTIKNLDEFNPVLRKPRICCVTQYFEVEEEEEKKEEKEEEKLSEKNTEENLNKTTYFLPESESDDDQEPSDFWDRVQRELEEEYKDGSDWSIQNEQYWNDVEKSDGFDVGFYPLLTRGMVIGNWVLRYYDLADDDDDTYTSQLNRLVYLSQLAICVYNMKEVKDFDNVKVLMAMSFGTGAKDLNITFEASSPGGNAVTFQTRILTALGSKENIEIEFVRVKSD